MALDTNDGNRKLKGSLNPLKLLKLNKGGIDMKAKNLRILTVFLMTVLLLLPGSFALAEKPITIGAPPV
jgi:hypothetical protein